METFIVLERIDKDVLKARILTDVIPNLTLKIGQEFEYALLGDMNNIKRDAVQNFTVTQYQQLIITTLLNGHVVRLKEIINII